MKRILMSILTIALVSIVAVGATKAYFDDTETSADNSYTAGTLNLNIDNQEGTAVAHVTFNGVVPAIQWLGAEYDNQWVLKNTGSIPGHVTYKIKNIRNWEMDSCISPEVVAGDVTCGAGSDQGELGSQIKLLFQLNQDPYGYNQEIYPLNSGLNVPYLAPAYHLNAGETKNVFLRSWLINAANNNLVQGDKVEFDIEFKLEQDI